MVTYHQPGMRIIVVCCVTFCFANVFGYPIVITESGVNPVALYGTVIRIFIQLVNKGYIPYTVSIIPRQCCLIVDKNDMDCRTMSFTDEAVLQLSSRHSGDNSTGRATFSFYNMYARYRNGSCGFTIRTAEGERLEWSHTVNFNTYPDMFIGCPGVDQDPDRNCTPVDCAIKYKGQKNFYQKSAGRCEAVVQCNTVGKDGHSMIAFYDWENNACQRLDWLQKDNYASQVESDSIPVRQKSNRRAQEFEPEPSTNTALECNRGHQEGAYCVCNEGWISSGIHGNDVLNFHWCDTEKVDPSTSSLRPRRLHWLQEVAIVAVSLVVQGSLGRKYSSSQYLNAKTKLLALANAALAVVWAFAVIELWWEPCCASSCSRLSPARLAFLCLRRACRKKGSLDLQDDE